MSQETKTDYEERFGGVGRLLGRAALERLRAAHVGVVGVGGVGSWAVEALARSGVGAITMIDLDDVCVTNVNRQVPAIEGNIGRAKVEALAERVRAINPACRAEAVQEFFTAASAERLLAGNFDWVIDAIDKVGNKARLIAECVARKIPVLTVGGAGGKRDATQVRAGDLGEAWGDELLRLLRKKLRREHGFAAGEQRGQANWGVRCVWSGERPAFTEATAGRPERGMAMDCENGWGTGVWVTGAFGLAAAGEVVRAIAAEPRAV